jgi:hypothetical protein
VKRLKKEMNEDKIQTKHDRLRRDNLTWNLSNNNGGAIETIEMGQGN